MGAHDLLVLGGGPARALDALRGAIRRRDTWEAMGFSIGDARTAHGIEATYRGERAQFWTLDREGDRWAGMLSGACPVQGHGVVFAPDGGEEPWYFRARHDAWAFSLAGELTGDPIGGPTRFVWSEPYANAGWMEHEHAWDCVARAIAMYRDPLVQRTLGDEPRLPFRDVWRDTTCWPAMAVVAAAAGGELVEIEHVLAGFGVRMLSWALELPFAIGRDETAHAAALAAAGGSAAALDRVIADAIRAAWPQPNVAGMSIAIVVGSA